MNRREALRNVALLMGGAISATTLSVIAESCNRPSGSNDSIFTAEQENIAAELADTIIPETDTPGAKAAGVGPFLVTMLTDCYPQHIQKTFTDGLDDLEKRAQKRYAKAFVSISPQERATVLQELVDELKSQKTADPKPQGGRRRNAAAGKKEPGFFQLAKELTMLGYFSSEVGAKQALVYLAVPGRYDACTDLQPGQKAWAI